MLEPSLILLVTGILVFASILASRISDRLGLPALVVFLCIGMLAGSDGPGGIYFENAAAANFVGTIALAFILFSGGLDTNWRLIRPVLVRGIVLSTGGVVLTAVSMGLFAWLVFGFSPVVSLLLGAIISSTDAAAVFSVLRGKGVGLKGNLRPLLEFESGSNDPMAIFLTLSLTQLLITPEAPWSSLIMAFFINMVLGVVAGLAIGRFAAFLLNRIRLDYEGLYPVVSLSLVLLTFGAAEILQGNGFLAVYVCGIVLNGVDFAHKRSVAKFHDGIAWLMQIGMFLVLGLLVYPSELPGVALMSLLAALFLMFVARPLAVFLCLWGSEFSRNDRILVSWTGLRGAVPIVLATYPLMAGYEQSTLIFDVVFFIVLTSVMIQGTLLMPIARKLKVDEPLASRPTFSLSIERQGLLQGETREIEILPEMCAVGKRVADLDVPTDILILLIGRGDGFVVPRGQTQIQPYDTLLLLGEGTLLKETQDAICSPTMPAPRKVASIDPLAALPQSTADRFLAKQVVLVGYGRVGRGIEAQLAAKGVPVVVVDESRTLVESLRKAGKAAVVGDATDPVVLVQAHIARAAVLIVATPDTIKVRRMVEVAKAINADIHVVIRSHNEKQATQLEQELAGTVFVGEQILAGAIVDHVVKTMTYVPTTGNNSVDSDDGTAP